MQYNALKRSLKYSFWNSVDNMFHLFILNFFWFLIHLIPIYCYSMPIPYQGNLPDPFSLFGVLPFVTNSEANTLFLITVGTESIDLIKSFHKVILFGVIVFCSPFSFAIWKINAEISKKNVIKIRTFFLESYRQFFKALAFMSIGVTICIFSYINIQFYQNLFNNEPFFTYISIFTIIAIEAFSFMLFLQAIPLMINENKSILTALKESYPPLMTFLPTTTILLFGYLFTLLLVRWHFIPGLDFILMIFFYPAFFGQFLNEHYLTNKEHFGQTRDMEETRRFKEFIFPWKESQY